MLKDTIEKIRERIEATPSLSGERKDELTALISTLESEVGELSKTHGEAAESIADFANISTREATRPKPNPEVLEHSLGGLSASVEGFEKSHPRLVQIVNNISSTLSNLGI
jgi:hypothetical protein